MLAVCSLVNSACLSVALPRPLVRELHLILGNQFGCVEVCISFVVTVQQLLASPAQTQLVLLSLNSAVG